MPPTIAHPTTESLPRVVLATAGTSTLDVLLPFRVDLDDPARTVTGWELDVEVESTPVRGVKSSLKPYAYKQWEGYARVTREMPDRVPFA